MPRIAHIVLTAALTALWTFIIWEILVRFGPDWTRYAPASCQPACFCEFPRTGNLLLQPANTWSSLAFIAVGGWIALGAANHPRSALGIPAALWLGLTAIAIGIGSALLHATLTLWGQFADVAGMYLLGAFILTRAATRSTPVAIALYTALVTTLLALLWALPETRRWLFAALLLTALVLEWTHARPRRPGIAQHWLLLAPASLIAGFALWLLDQSRLACDPMDWLQGHAAWHLLGATSILFIYLYYRSEQEPGAPAIRSSGISKGVIAMPDERDSSPGLAGNPAAGNPDRVRSKDIPAVPEIEGEDEVIIPSPKD